MVNANMKLWHITKGRQLCMGEMYYFAPVSYFILCNNELLQKLLIHQNDTEYFFDS